MTPTIKAILARFNQDKQLAFAYCVRMQRETSNPALRLEYHMLAQTIWNMEAAHAS
jgi:hypothetical protein